jgi:hypothetical protein
MDLIVDARRAGLFLLLSETQAAPEAACDVAVHFTDSRRKVFLWPQRRCCRSFTNIPKRSIEPA